MVAVKLATVAALLQLASAAAITEPRHYPTFGLRVIAEGTKYHNKYIHLSGVTSSPLKVGLAPEGDSGHSIDAEFFIREDGHLSYGQPGSKTGTFVLGFDPEQASWSGVADAYFLPEKTPAVIFRTGKVQASAGDKNVVSLDGLELKVKGEERWLICPFSNGQDKNGNTIIVHNLAYNGARGDPKWDGSDSAADHCTEVAVRKVDLE